MPDVSGFPLLPSLTGESKIPVSQRSNAEQPGNFNTTPNQLASWLEDNGFARNVDDVPLRFFTNFADLTVGAPNTLYAVLQTGRGLYTWDGSSFVHMYDLTTAGGGGSTSGGPTYTSLSQSGITVEVGYFGATAPTISGSAGNYQITFAAGTAPASIDIEAPAAESNTAGGNFSFTIEAPRRHKPGVQLEDLSTGAVFVSRPGVEILRSSNAAGQATVTVNGIEAVTDGFGLKLSF